MQPISEVYNEDCIAGMKRYPDKYFDLAVVDPPYGIKRDGHHQDKKPTNGGRKNFEFKGWDSAIPTAEYWDELYRVSKNQIVWGANYMTEFLKPSMGWIVWRKNRGSFTSSDAELAYTSYNKALREYTKNPFVLIQEGGTIHPTQKPICLYDFCYQYAKLEQGDLILDTHLGSGSSRIAAHKAGLHFVGFEIDKEYFDAQEKRFKNFISQLTLF